MLLIRLLAVLACVAMLAGPVIHNETRPFLLGMPFPLGWIAIWIVLTAAIVAVVYAIDPANRERGR
jgi:hypothetical protein